MISNNENDLSTLKILINIKLLSFKYIINIDLLCI